MITVTSPDDYERLYDEIKGGGASHKTTIEDCAKTYIPRAAGQTVATNNIDNLTAATLPTSYTLQADTSRTPALTFARDAPLDFSSMQDTPDIISELEEAYSLMIVWLGTSLGTLVLSFCDFNLGTLSAICGLAGSVGHACSCFRSPDVASAIKTSYVMSIMVAVLSTIVCIQSLDAAVRVKNRCGGAEECSGLVEYVLLLALWYAMHAALSVVVVWRMSRLRRLLNPITNGVVTL